MHRLDGRTLIAFSIAAAPLAAVAAPYASANENADRLEPILVQGRAAGHIEELAQSRAEAETVPGNVSVIPASEYDGRVVLGLADALKRSAGVFARNHSGQESARISIRGSGITSTSGMRGIRLLRDGLPLGRSDDFGDTIYADPSGADYIELYRGANALRFGAANLGGAINLVSPTGYSRPGLEFRTQAGSDGHVKGQLRAGQVFANGVDAFASVSGFHSNGFRQNSEETISRFYGNIGYRFSSRSQGRLHLTSEHYRVQMPGAITRDQLEADPSAANSSNLRAGSRIKTSPRWHVAYQHDWQLRDADELSVGVFHTGTRFVSPGANLTSNYDATDYGASLRHEIHAELGGHDNRFVWGANYAHGRSNNQAYWPDYMPRSPLLPAPGAQLAALDATRTGYELFAENSYYIRPDLALVLGAQAAWAERKTSNRIAPLASSLFANGDASARYFGFNPKAGLVWDVHDHAQVFANLSRSFEAPNNLAFYTLQGELQAQRATTLELGTRGGNKRLEWEAAVYHAWLKNELVEVPLPGYPGAVLARNADKTRHMGLELSLNGEINLAMPGSLEWNVAYTWSRFQFAGDAVYGNNRLPGIPAHVAQLGVTYRHPSGFYGGPSLELASGWDVDQANSLTAPGYGLVNMTVGYEAPGGRYRVFLDARNLADKHYASTTDYVVDAGARNLAVFNPGQTRAVYLGFQANW